MIRDEKIKTDSKKFLDIACEYFANIGANMSKKLPFSNSSSFKIHSKSGMKSFLLEEITLEEINFYIDNLKSNSSPGIDDLPPKFIKLAKCILSPHLVIKSNQISLFLTQLQLQQNELKLKTQNAQLKAGKKI